MSTAYRVENHPDRRRFTADVGEDQDAVLAYAVLPDGALDLQHTVVPAAARGAGAGDALVRAAVAYARAHGVKLVATCPFVAGWLERHRDQADAFAASGA